MSKKILLIGIAIIIIAVLTYIYHPYTKAGCDNLKKKIESDIAESNTCNLASDCSIPVDAGCDFRCGTYLSKKINQSQISRFNRRCSTCNETCYFEFTSPACLDHTCQVTGGAVFAKTEKNEHNEAEEIKLQVTNNLLQEITYSFPIELCLRPTIMRLEKYNKETTEWLSSGVGLLFENDRVIFYENPDQCPAYKIKNCKKDQAEKFIDTDTLKINEYRNYTIPASITTPCDETSQENLAPMQGRYRIGLYYEPPEGIGKQIYSNEFVIH